MPKAAPKLPKWLHKPLEISLVLFEIAHMGISAIVWGNRLEQKKKQRTSEIIDALLKETERQSRSAK